MKANIKVTAVDYHRNGVSGEPFYVILFESDGKNMVGIVFEKTSYVAVFDKDLFATGEIRFLHNSWRGDYFESALRSAIEEFEQKEK